MPTPYRTMFLGVLLFLAAASPAVAVEKDHDADGIPDAVERRLGTDPKRAERPEVVWQDRRPVTLNPVDIRAIAFAWVGKGRTLWRIDLASEWPVATHVSNLYFDLDHNKATGRKDAGPAGGTEIQLGIAGLAGGAHRYNPDGTHASAPNARPRCWAKGNSFYVCLDIPLLQKNQRSVGRVSVGVHVTKPKHQRDLVPSVKLDLPPEPQQKPPPLTRRPVPARAPIRGAMDPAQLNGDFEQNLKGWASRGAKIERTTEVARVGKAAMKLSGPSGKWNEFVRSAPLRLKANTYYRFSAWMRVDRYPPPMEPRFIVARVWIHTYDVRKVGQWQRFETAFLTPAETEPTVIELYKGVGRKESRDVDALVYVDGIRLEELRHEPPRISHFEATPCWDEDGRTGLRLTWITQRPYAAEVGCRQGTNPERKLVEPRGSQRNHRIIIPNVAAGQEIACRLTLIGLDGKRHPQAIRTIALKLPEPAGKAARRRVSLRVAETGGVDRRNWPATFGVPLPQGDLADPTRARLLDPSGSRPERHGSVGAQRPSARAHSETPELLT